MGFTIKSNYTAVLAIVLTSVLLTSQPTLVTAQLPGIPEGVKRGDIIVFRAESKSAAPDNMNPWIPGNPNLGAGGSPIYEPLYYINVTNMETVPMLASGMPQYNDDFTVLTIPIRQGVYWNDGVAFSAEDVVYSINLHLETEGLANSAQFQTWVENVYAEDAYTVVIELTTPNPKYHLTFTNVMGMTGWLVMPKHVWENENPLTFTNNPPVGTAPYVVEDYDPNGFWMLYKRRDDWDTSALGQVVGKPKPIYVLRQYYTPDDPKLSIAISRHEMDTCEVTMELWDTVKGGNPYAIGFWKDFPYAWQYGICDHGVGLNCEKSPTDLVDVRWALALAINMTEVNILALDAKGRMATFHSLSVPYLQAHFEDELIPWINDFELSDGYKPFDDTIPQQIAAFAESEGNTLAASPEEIYGPGWWRYDVEEAAKLLEDNGFTRDSQGSWFLPTGERWTLNIVIPAFHMLGSRIGYAVAEQWRAFGIDVLDEALESGMYNSRGQTGDFDAVVVWPWCGMLLDPWNWWQAFHDKYYKPIGEVAPQSQQWMRWQNSEFSDLLDELGALTPEDPQVIGIVADLVKISFEEMLHINCYLGSKVIVHDTYAWENWNTGDNWYWEESYWNPMWSLPILVNLRHTGNVPFTEEEEPGPGPGPVIPEELEETIQLTAENVLAVSQAVEELSSDVSTLASQVEAVSGAVAAANSTITTVVTIEAIAIIILAIGLVVALMRRS